VAPSRLFLHSCAQYIALTIDTLYSAQSYYSVGLFPFMHRLRRTASLGGRWVHPITKHCSRKITVREFICLNYRGHTQMFSELYFPYTLISTQPTNAPGVHIKRSLQKSYPLHSMYFHQIHFLSVVDKPHPALR